MCSQKAALNKIKKRFRSEPSRGPEFKLPVLQNVVVTLPQKYSEVKLASALQVKSSEE
jgi:hypothetical protein